MISLAFLAAGLFAVPAGLARGTANGAVAGRLMDPAGRPVAGADVRLKDQTTGFSAAVISGEDGMFSFSAVPAGAGILQIRKYGYMPLDRAIDVRLDGRLDLEIVLHPNVAGATGSPGPVDPPGLKPMDILGGGQTASPAAFNPAISIIPSGHFYHDGRQGDAAALLGQADGFPNSLEGNRQGFNLGETELAFSGSVDPYFDAGAVLAVSTDDIEVEEAYLQTRRLPFGLQLRAGKFKSGIGYMNKQHSHQWDFVDQALPYTMMFGSCLSEVGLQINWLAPLPFYTLVGLEALQGENSGAATFIGPDEGRSYFDRKSGPRLFTGFIKVSPGLGYSCALQGGLFGGHSILHQEDFTRDVAEAGEVTEALQGKTTFYGTDWVFKFDAAHEYGQGDLTVQSEYICRIKDLDVVATSDESIPAGNDLGTRKFKQDGLYAQVVYGFAPRWTAGLRYDIVGLTNRVDLSGLGRLAYGTAVRWSVDITKNLTEFSRIRLQYNRLKLRIDAGKETFGQVYLQYQVSLGAHGAHKF